MARHIIQGVTVTVLAAVYFVMADVSVAFFLLSAVTITLYLITYMLMFAAAIRLRYSQPDFKHSYCVPGGNLGMWRRRSPSVWRFSGAKPTGLVRKPINKGYVRWI